MKIWLLGAHQPTNLRLARDGGAQHVGLSFNLLLPRLPKKKPYVVAERFEGLEVYLASGGHALHNKTDEEVSEFEDAHWQFVEANADGLTLVTEIDDPRIDVSYRNEYAELLGDRFVPVWLEDRGLKDLEALAEAYEMVGIRAESVRNSPMLATRMRPLTARYGTQWHVLDGARPDELMTNRFQSAATTAWLAPMRNGETIVWDGTRMHRFPKRMKDQARRQHRARFIQAGFDADEILEGEKYEEITRYTVSAFVELENYLNRRQPSTNPFSVEPEEKLSTSEGGNESAPKAELALPDVDNSAPVVRNEMRAPVARTEPRKMLPVFAVESTETTEVTTGGEEVTTTRDVLRSTGKSLRQCDTCSINAVCTEFQPGAECAFEIPVDLKTKDQVFGTAVAMLEIQAQRVAFMRMQEELNGGYADPNTSSEMDRFYRMLAALKELQENREYINLRMEAKGQSGILSALLGADAQATRRLERPIPSDNIIDAYFEEN